MDESHFQSVVRLFNSRERPSGEAASNDKDAVGICKGEKPGTLVIKQPHPPSTLSFTEVYASSERRIYKKTVSPLVDSTLEGFNGTVISIGRTRSKYDSLLLDTKEGMVMRSAKQMFHCLKKLKASGLLANLVVPCSYILLHESTAYDLFYDLSADKDSSNSDMELQFVDGSPTPPTVSEAKKASDVGKLLEHGKATKERIPSIGTDRSYHAVFTIGIKYAAFGSMFAPISGTLSFISVNLPDGIDLEQLATSRAPPTPALCGIHEFVSTIHRLTKGEVAVSDSPKLPPAPLHKSVYTPMFSDALGGNSKTILITNISEEIVHLEEQVQLLELSSKATRIENRPDKTELAKKALMDAYMSELRKLYGNTETEKMEDEALNEIASDNKGAEMVAKALASAVKRKEDGDSDNSDDSDDEGEKRPQSSTPSKSTGAPRTPITVRSRRITLTKKGGKKDDPLQSSSTASIGTPSSMDLTVEALVSVIQDPDKGVPRARTGSLEHVKIYRGKGSVFSGEDIVRWFVQNIAGVETEEDAEQLGQILLDKEAIFHSEGSSVFANSSYLFYYARDPRPGNKPVTLEEIQALLGQNKEPSLNKESSSNKETSSKKEQNNNKEKKELLSKTEAQDFEETDFVEATDISSVKNDYLEVRDCITPELATLTPEFVSRQSSLSTTLERPTDLPIFNEQTSLDVESTLIAKTTIEAVLSDTPEEQNEISSKDADSLSVRKAEEEEIDEVHSVEGTPNLKAIQAVPLLETLEKCSDYPHPLHFQAATSNVSGVIKHLIHWYGVDQRDDHDRTPIMFAALGNKASSLRTLIEYGSVIDHRDRRGFTALHIACYHGHKEALSVLISKGANLGIKDKMLHSAFHWSTVPLSTSCLKLLLRHSSVCSMEREEDKSSLTPLHWAMFYDHVEHLKLLLPRCTDVLKLDSIGRTFAIYAIQKGAEQCLQVLLKYCPLLTTVCDKNELSPLHHASAQPSSNLMMILLKAMQEAGNFVMETKDKYGRTPVHYAVLYGQAEVLKLLIQNGADPYPKDMDDKLPLDLRREFGVEDNEAIKQILEKKESATADQTDKHSVVNNTQSSGVCRIL